MPLSAYTLPNPYGAGGTDYLAGINFDRMRAERLRKAQAALKQHATIEPVLSGTEGDTATVPTGFDPSAIRVVGNVTGTPPFTGQIQHPGWRVKELKLAAPPDTSAPAQTRRFPAR